MEPRRQHPFFCSYEANTNGDVFNARKDRKLVGSVYNGYIKVKLWKDNKPYLKFAHVIVFEAFHGAKDRRMQVDHVNTIKTDNRLTNLQLLTPKQHAQKTFKENPLMFLKAGAGRVRLWIHDRSIVGNTRSFFG